MYDVKEELRIRKLKRLQKKMQYLWEEREMVENQQEMHLANGTPPPSGACWTEYQRRGVSYEKLEIQERELLRPGKIMPI